MWVVLSPKGSGKQVWVRAQMGSIIRFGRTPETTTPKSGLGHSRTFKSVEMFGDVQEVFIEHGGINTELRRTSKGKLILTK